MSDSIVPTNDGGGSGLRGVPMATDPAKLTFDQLWKMSEIFAKSGLVPKAFVGKPEDVFIAFQMSVAMRVTPFAMMRNLAVINGRPTIWGDLALTLAKQHPDYVSHREWFEFEDDKVTVRAANCEIVTKGRHGSANQVTVARFSVQEARLAKLWDKEGPWRQYPNRMLQMRARSWAIRDALPDALNGVDVAEEAMDMDARPVVATASTGVDRLTAALGVQAAAPAAPAPARIAEDPAPVVVEVKTRAPNPVPIDMDTIQPMRMPTDLDSQEALPEPPVYGETMPTDDVEPELDPHDTTVADDAGKRALLATLREKRVEALPWITKMLYRQPSAEEPMTRSELDWLRWHAERHQ